MSATDFPASDPADEIPRCDATGCNRDATNYCTGCECWRCESHDCECLDDVEAWSKQ